MKLTLPNSLHSYQPRACDCDFCMAQKAAYLSDLNGVLEVFHQHKLEGIYQGSEQAVFWQCKACHNLILVSCEFASGVKGAVNAGVFSQKYTIGSAVYVSPKMLSPQEKRERWQSVWLTVNFQP